MGRRVLTWQNRITRTLVREATSCSHRPRALASYAFAHEGVAYVSGRRRQRPLLPKLSAARLRGRACPQALTEELRAHDFIPNYFWVARSCDQGQQAGNRSAPAITARCRRVVCTPRKWGPKALPTSSERLTAGRPSTEIWSRGPWHSGATRRACSSPPKIPLSSQSDERLIG